MFVVYTLHSPSHNKIYIGFSSDLEKRLLAHNELATKGWTISYRPWTLVYTKTFATKAEAIKHEKGLKSAKGRDFIWKLVLSKTKV